jgi:hypothetical protein
MFNLGITRSFTLRHKKLLDPLDSKPNRPHSKPGIGGKKGKPCRYLESKQVVQPVAKHVPESLQSTRCSKYTFKEQTEEYDILIL